MSFHRCDTVIKHIFNLDITIDIIHLQSIRSEKNYHHIFVKTRKIVITLMYQDLLIWDFIK